MVRRERFAPSPSGHLHLGHAYSALAAWDAAAASGGEFLLRIEDIDRTRSKPAFETAIYEDLSWLGIQWIEPVMRQSERMPAYLEALERLAEQGLCYPCRCSRRDIREALAAPQESAPERGSVSKPATTAAYPGTCRGRSMSGREASDSVRLDIRKAIAFLGGADAIRNLRFEEISPLRAGIRHLDPEDLLGGFGDIVLARRDAGTSYHLSVVVDDAAQGVTHVTRGADLFEATPLHRLLQALLELPVPIWNHHPLVRDENGRRLAKREDALAIRGYRERGATPGDVRRLAEQFVDQQPAAQM